MSKTNYYSKAASSAQLGLSFNIENSIVVSEALLKFSLEHGYPEQSKEIESIRGCILALKDGKIGEAKREFARVHFGKEGFDEWWPEVVFENENDNYVKVVFTGLCQQWRNELRAFPTTS